MVDCGGGTVDISAFQVNEAAEGKLEQVGEATGGPWGATNVDKMLENFLQVRFDLENCTQCDMISTLKMLFFTKG